jgi:hypothetical protein
MIKTKRRRRRDFARVRTDAESAALHGTGPRFMKIGGRVRYRPADLAKYVSDKTRTFTAEHKAAA